MTNTIDLTTIRRLEERYPFNEAELEILSRCHDHINDANQDDFLMKLALASPYSYFFVPEPHPGDAMRERVSWIENNILPAGFSNELRAAISSDAFVEYANQGQSRSLERFLEGIADTGRRGTKEALKVIYNLVDEPQPRELADFVVRLSLASDLLVVPILDQKNATEKLLHLEPAIQSFAASLTEFLSDRPLSLPLFQHWADEKFPMFSTPLSMFTHQLLFHGHDFPEGRLLYKFPDLGQDSDIFLHPNSAELYTLSFTSSLFGGKWHRLYSSFFDGRSFNRMEFSVLGYTGPTVLIIRTTCDNILGAFAETPWKENRDFYGSSDCFLFQLYPDLRVLRAQGKEHNFMYLHSDYFHGPLSNDGIPHGLGLGGTISKPRLFIPESFEHCTADYLDSTFQPGELLPSEALEKFEIKCLEVWGVGGEIEIKKALNERQQYRERMRSSLEQARTVHDKSAFARDLKSGLMLGKLYEHQEYVRGRQEFAVDDKHGGYKLQH